MLGPNGVSAVGNNGFYICTEACIKGIIPRQHTNRILKQWFGFWQSLSSRNFILFHLMNYFKFVGMVARKMPKLLNT